MPLYSFWLLPFYSFCFKTRMSIAFAVTSFLPFYSFCCKTAVKQLIFYKPYQLLQHKDRARPREATGGHGRPKAIERHFFSCFKAKSIERHFFQLFYRCFTAKAIKRHPFLAAKAIDMRVLKQKLWNGNSQKL